MNKKTKKIILVILIVIVAGVFAFSTFQVVNFLIRSKVERDYTDKISDNYSIDVEVDDEEKEICPKKVDFKALKERNSDIIGWIYCEDTVIDYPIVKGENNDEYIRANLDHKWTVSGTLFVDSRNSADFSDYNTIIYGHNMYNDGSMFASLFNYKKEGYYEAHPVMWLLTENGDYKLEVTMGYVTNTNSANYVVFKDLVSLRNHINNSIENSVFKSNVKPESVNKLITLSTCSYEFESARFVLCLSATKV